jgi:DNA-binding response OmpR family regulator
MKILLIEDEATLCETLVTYLEEEGYRCEYAGTVEYLKAGRNSSSTKSPCCPKTEWV